MNSCISIYHAAFLYIRETREIIVRDMCDIFCKNLYKICSIYDAGFKTIRENCASMSRDMCDTFCKILYNFVTIYGVVFVSRLRDRVYGVAYHETIRKSVGAQTRDHIWCGICVPVVLSGLWCGLP